MSSPDTPQTGWCFDPVPPSGARQGGDPAQFVFEPDVSALVRETLQNSNDQLAPHSERVSVALRGVRIEGAELERLRSKFDWPNLSAHVASVEVAKDRFEPGLEMTRSGSLSGLWIEDRGTTGLVGDETGSGNFAALCRDRLFSEKQRAEAGGSFGLGKAVLWRFSSVSTVAFYSRIGHGDHAGRERFIIKSSLPYHVRGDGQYAGDGWYGVLEDSKRGVRAVSVWDGDARSAAVALGGRPFEDGESGTSIFIVGFDDPASDDDHESLDAIEARLGEEARRSFWPALSRDRLRVRVGTEPVEVGDGDVASQLSSMLRIYDSNEETADLAEVGQVVVERITVGVPATRGDERPSVEAVADVVIQLVDEHEPDIGFMWCFRGPGMVIERRDLRRVSLSARPFRAILICGDAVRYSPPNQTELEVFLKTAEPPAHDRWMPTPRLKERYKSGWKVGLQRLMAAADEVVRKHVALSGDRSEGGPEVLRRLFRVGNVGGGRSESDFHFRDLDATIVDGSWQFRAKVMPNLPTESAWSTVIDVEFPEERGRKSARGNVGVVEVTGAVHELVDGQVHISAPPGTEFVEVAGHTDPSRHPVAVQEAAIDLVIRSRAEEGEHEGADRDH